ncbi:VOC family protein [Streptomyces sp. HNM0575]|uniref:VOC family protein n=1 Tax=Streptomyces sp. HNM0575 TaxID=2716338 RepID=UPI00145F6CE5|nr:VOC family protein [Streptomyces sp. HNM0575]
MSTKIFVNLPVKDLDKSRDFFSRLGYSFNPQFSDENAACLVISEDIFAMLLIEPFFKSFTKKEVADSRTSTEAMIALSADSRAAVDELADKALAAGGSTAGEPQDHGFMYGRAFYDLDDHHWEVVWMDPAAIEQQPA